METKKPPYVVRPRTAVLTRGFDPRLSVGSARPAVFRSSTYVFSSPESAERAFAIALGPKDARGRRKRRSDLRTPFSSECRNSRRPGRASGARCPRGCSLQFRHGSDFNCVLCLVPSRKILCIYDATLRRHLSPHTSSPRAARNSWNSRACRRYRWPKEGD